MEEIVMAKEMFMAETKEETKPKPPLAGLVYGEIIYWGTLVGALIAVLGSTFAFISRSNVMDVSYVFSAIWQGKDVATVWKEGIEQFPQGHWYLHNITTGDGLTMFGIALGVFAVIPGMFLSAILLLKKREYFFATLAIIAGIICLTACLGLFALPQR